MVNRAKQIRLDQGPSPVSSRGGVAVTAKQAARAPVSLSGMSARTLKKIENGEDVNAASLARLSAFYGLKASELLAPAHFETPREAA
jgi:transcriptional regulator with XRE-family HTH domain